VPEHAVTDNSTAPPAAHLLAALLGTLVIYGLAAYSGWRSYTEGFEMPGITGSLANMLVNVCLFGGLLLVLLHFLSRQTLASLTLKDGSITADLLDGFGLAGVLLAAQLGFNVLFMQADNLPAANQAIARGLAADGWLLLVWAGPVIWLQAALLEEFTRSFILSRLWQVWPGESAKISAVFAAAVLFGLGHVYQGWGGVGVTAVIGFILGYYYLRRGRVLPMIVAHGVYNTIVLAFLVLAARNGLL
jgi:membrane protease YdiL (CAAX protease family)